MIFFRGSEISRAAEENLSLANQIQDSEHAHWSQLHAPILTRVTNVGALERKTTVVLVNSQKWHVLPQLGLSLFRKILSLRSHLF